MKKRIAVLVSVFLLALGLMAAPASAVLCIVPGEVSPAHDSAEEDLDNLEDVTVAEPPPNPEDFVERGRSLVDNPAGKAAAWEAHFNSPVIFGPPDTALDECVAAPESGPED